MADKALSNLTSIGTLAAGDTGDIVYVVVGGNSRQAHLGQVAGLDPANSPTFAGLAFSTGAAISWAAGDVSITHSANGLSFAGASSGYSFDAAINGTLLSASVQGTGLNGIDGDQFFIYKEYTAAPGGAGHAAGEIAVARVQRSANYTGGTIGNVENGLWVPVTVAAGVANFEWGILSQMTNNATAGQNVAMYAQVTKNSTGPSWGNVSEVIETTGANPASGTVGFEIDMTANGTDTSGNRIGLDIVAQTYLAGTLPTIGHGIRIGPESGVAANGQYANGITFLKTFATGINLSDADCSVADIITKGAVLVGGLSAKPTTSGGTVTSVLAVAGLGSITGANYSADANPTILTLAKSRNATKGSHTIVNDGDTIGDIRFEASDGTNFIRAAVIRATVSGTPGTNDMPGVMQFFTTPDGSATPVERLRISSTGEVTASAPLGGIGYRTGAGGAVTQATSRTTGVTLNTITGQITTNNASLAAEASASFVVTNSAVAATDTVVCSIASGVNGGNTDVFIAAVSAGSFAIRVANNNAAAGTAETGAIVINFAVVKAVAA